MSDLINPLAGIPKLRARMALAKLADASEEALRYFDAGDYDTAASEIARCRAAMNTLAAIRREARKDNA